MATILAISSQVVRGTIGNSIAAFALQRMGHTVWQIPTIILSNHPGYGSATGQSTDTENIMALWNGLKAHGWETELDAILTGYMPTASIAIATARIVREAQSANPSLKVLCDPVIGDEPKGRYVPREAAETIRDQILPLADIITPNLYELNWLTGREHTATRADVCRAAQQLPTSNVVTTSAPGSSKLHIENVLTSHSGTMYCETQRMMDAPKGTGDLFSAILLAHLANRASVTHALARASSATEVVLRASHGSDTLNIVSAQKDWISAPPAKLETAD